MRAGLVGKSLEDPLPEPVASQARPDVHPLHLAVGGVATLDAVDEQDPSAPCRAAIDAGHEESNALRDEAGHAETAPALDRVERRQVLFLGGPLFLGRAF